MSANDTNEDVVEAAPKNLDSLRRRLDDLKQIRARLAGELADNAQELIEDATRWSENRFGARGAFAIERDKRRAEIDRLLRGNRAEAAEIERLIHTSKLANLNLSPEELERRRQERAQRKRDRKAAGAEQRTARHSALMLSRVDPIKQKRIAFARLVTVMARRPEIETWWPEWAEAARALVAIAGEQTPPEKTLSFLDRIGP